MGSSPGRGCRPLRTSHKRFLHPPGQGRHEPGEGACLRVARRSAESYSPDLADVIQRKQPPASPPEQRPSQDQLRQHQFRSLTGERKGGWPPPAGHMRTDRGALWLRRHRSAPGLPPYTPCKAHASPGKVSARRGVYIFRASDAAAGPTLFCLHGATFARDSKALLRGLPAITMKRQPAALYSPGVTQWPKKS